MGRPTELNTKTRKAITTALRKGLTRAAASEIAGITDRTFRSWMDRGRAGEHPFEDFAQAVEKAEAQVEEEMTQVLLDAGKKGEWRAAAFWLERRRKDYRPQSRNEITGADGGPVEITTPVTLKEKLESLGERLTGQAAEPCGEAGSGPKGQG